MPKPRTDSVPARERDARLREAVSLYSAGRLAEAEAAAKKLHEREPRFAPAAHLLGVIAARTGRIEAGIEWLRQAVALDPLQAASRNEFAAQLRLSGRIAESVAEAREAVRLTPSDAGAHNNLGASLMAAEACEEAAGAFARAAELAPTVAAYRMNLAAARWRLGERDEARAVLRQAADLETGVPGRLRLALAMREQGLAEDAERLLRRVAAAKPDDPSAHDLLATLLREGGRFAEAETLCRKRIAAAPKDAAAYLGLTLTRRMTELDRPLVTAMEALAADAGLSPRERARLDYALGKSADDLGEYERAIRHFDRANAGMAQALEKSGRKLDKARHAANIDRMIARFGEGYLERESATGSDSERPVFIVGMIRSGTTLTEQILSAHPMIGAGGELAFWGRQGALLADLESGGLAAETKQRLASQYSGLLDRLAPGAVRVTDKMPTNYLMLGLIHAAFPRARIIHCRRDPVDTCLSIWFTPFEDLPDFAGDRDSIVFYYEQYARIMAHWHKVLPPERFLEFDYEDLIADREGVIRRLIAFCGVPWDEACLNPEGNRRVVATPSAWQVRQPVYRTSAGRWRNYADHLGAFARLRRD